MITSKKELKEYILADESRYGKRRWNFIGWLLHDETYFSRKYLRTLRRLEYMINKKKKIWDYPYYAYLLFRHRALSYKYKVYIIPNTVGKGLFIPHIGGGIYLNVNRLGDNCIVTGGVVIGNKTGQDKKAVIGNNVELTLGVKVIGAVTIGDNVIVAPNSVVVKDIESNTIVSGVPAKFLKKKDK